MKGTILVTYKILCKADLNKELTLNDLLSNEKIAKIIKSEYAKGFRNLILNAEPNESVIKIQTQKELHTFEVQKDDFADLLDLAEEDAQNKKLLKKECERVELVDIETMSTL
ncbi:hypothetical protein JHD46_00330 [Sulfurimonas sp. SAG-AH-194-C20]|nr:hypothetical protein [Sulfurimonas sp. SAG-AH-194-C20]MDF1878077.1 hypothetical protein [Sulfurimonas sp. SAG-AH-194-C20]